MFRSIADLRIQLRTYGLEKLETTLIALARPSVWMGLNRSDDKRIPIGSSKFGGDPDLPSGCPWPTNKSAPLTFIAQFNLSNLSSYLVAHSLQSDGLLTFFCDTIDTPYRIDGVHNGWHIVYTERGVPLHRVAHPRYLDRFGSSHACPVHRISFTQVLSLPNIFLGEEHSYGIDFNLSYRASHEAYWQMLQANSPRPRHFWFGHPWRIQRDVEEDVAITFREFMKEERPSPDDYCNPAFMSWLNSEMDRWQFLFQIDTDDDLGVMWGDVGTLYVCIPKVSLVERRFEDCWTIMQCS